MKHVVSLETLDLVVDRNSAADLRCSVCVSFLRLPVVSCQNGHLFCESCVKREKLCPVCRVLIAREGGLARALFVERQMANTMVYCVYRFPETPDAKQEEWLPDPEGCQEQLRLSSREEHHAVCPLRFVNCPYCKHRCRLNKLDAHKEVCIYRLVKCPHCMEEKRGPAALEGHLFNCPEKPIKCNQCGKEGILHKNFTLHMRETCSERVVSCPFKEYGCKADAMKESEMGEHIKENAFGHMGMMQRTMEEQGRLANLVRETLNARIQQLQHELVNYMEAPKRPSLGIFKVDDWNKIVKEERPWIQSRRNILSGVPGFEFFVRVLPFGNRFHGPGDGAKSAWANVGLYLDVSKNPPPDVQITVNFSVAVNNVLNADSTVAVMLNNVTFPVEEDPRGRKNRAPCRSWSPGVILRDAITAESGYLSKDGMDTLKIDIVVTVISIVCLL